MRRLTLAAGLLALAAGVLAPSTSYAQQSLNIYFGGFVPTGEDGRYRDDRGRSGDALVSNLDFLSFDTKDFNGGTVGLEYLVGVGDYIDAGLGVGLYRRTVPSVYADYVNRNGSEIEQDLKLRMVPWTATVRFLPFGRSGVIEPYVGAGVAIVNWRYSESGEFVDFFDNSVFRDTYVGSGTATGPTVLGGIRIPVGSWGIGFETRWQDVKADLPADLGFATTRDGQRPWVDLGGWSYLGTVQIRF